jgi:hypothetical protein
MVEVLVGFKKRRMEGYPASRTKIRTTAFHLLMPLASRSLFSSLLFFPPSFCSLPSPPSSPSTSSQPPSSSPSSTYWNSSPNPAKNSKIEPSWI